MLLQSDIRFTKQVFDFKCYLFGLKRKALEPMLHNPSLIPYLQVQS